MLPANLQECLPLIDQSAAAIQADDDLMGKWLKNYTAHHRFRLAEDLHMLCMFARPGGRVAEFGSSPPILTLAAQRLGYEICGLDINPERFGQTTAQHSLDVRAVDFERQPVPLPDGHFDLVLFNEVFEHLRIDLIFTLSEVHRVTRPGGTLLLSTPNLRSVRGLWSLLRHGIAAHIGTDLYSEYDKLRLYGHMGHVREYTPTEVRRFLGKVGFDVRRTIYRFNRSAQAGGRRLTPFEILEAAICAAMPTLKPLFSVICEKSA